MAKPKKVLFITEEIHPYVPESTISQLGRRIPQMMQERGREIRTFMPKWGFINERRCQLHEVIRLSGMNLIIDDTDHLLIIKVASIPSARMQVYFIDNDDYFMKRLTSRDANGKEYEDNAERAIFYARGVLETVKKLRWVPDVIHCQGWISTIAPLYIKTVYKEEPCFRDSKVVFTPTSTKLELPTTAQFRESIVTKNMTGHELDDFPARLTLADLNRLALTYSDALMVTPQAHDDALIDYATQHELPILEGGDLSKEDATAYGDFFDKLCGTDMEEED